MSWSLNGAVRPATAVEEGPQADERLVVEPAVERQLGVDRRPRRPAASRRAARSTPAMPQAAWGIIPSTAARRGSDGAAGSRGWLLEGERDRLVDVVVRQAADADARPTGSEDAPLMVPPPAVHAVRSP